MNRRFVPERSGAIHEAEQDLCALWSKTPQDDDVYYTKSDASDSYRWYRLLYGCARHEIANRDHAPASELGHLAVKLEATWPAIPHEYSGDALEFACGAVEPYFARAIGIVSGDLPPIESGERVLSLLTDTEGMPLAIQKVSSKLGAEYLLALTEIALPESETTPPGVVPRGALLAERRNYRPNPATERITKHASGLWVHHGVQVSAADYYMSRPTIWAVSDDTYVRAGYDVPMSYESRVPDSQLDQVNQILDAMAPSDLWEWAVDLAS